MVSGRRSVWLTDLFTVERGTYRVQRRELGANLDTKDREGDEEEDHEGEGHELKG